MKHTKMIIAALLALTMTACGDTGTVEETTLSESVTSESVHTEESVLTTESETETETITEAETTTTAEVTTTVEVTTTEETTTAAEIITEVDSKGNTILKMTADTKFYECEFTDENSVTSAEEFENKELLDKAVEFLKESDFYANCYKQICEAGESQGYTDLSESMPECELVYAITDDFNGDGKEETAFLFSVNNIAPVEVWVNMGMTRCVLFADSDGDISMSDEEFSEMAQMRELKYNGFSHLVVSGGHNNTSQQTYIYSVQEIGLKNELNYGGCSGIVKDSSLEFALKMGFPQTSVEYLIFWNDDLKCYVTPKARHISGDEAKEIKGHMEISEENREYAESLDIIVIGNYYILPLSPMHTVTYEYKNGEYHRLETDGYDVSISEAESGNGTFGYIYCDNFDFETAENNLVKID